MGKKRGIWFAVLLAAAVGGCVWLILRPREPEPVYEGKPLSYWLEGFGPSTVANHPLAAKRPSIKDADAAMREAGTNALPLLFRMLRARDSDLKLKLMAIAQQQHFVAFHFVPATNRNALAMYALLRLGTNAGQAVPGLVKILEEQRSVESEVATIYSLGRMGRVALPALPALLQRTADPSPRIRWYSFSALGGIKTDLERVLPALVRGMGDSDTNVRAAAVGAFGDFDREDKAAIPALLQTATNSIPLVRCLSFRGLGRIRAEADIVVPVLLRGLDDPDRSVRLEAVNALGSFGMEARQAVPALIALAGDTHFRLRAEVIEALRYIAPAESEALAAAK